MSTLIYTRVSTTEQKTQRQLDELLSLTKKDSANVSCIIKEKISGTKPLFKRSEGSKIKSMVESGEIDCIYVHEISRLGRSVSDVSATIEFLIENNCNLRIMQAGLSLFNRSGEVNISNRMVMNVLVSMAQNEREVLSERTISGLNSARRQGKVLGKPITDEGAKVREMLSKGKNPTYIINNNLTSLSRSQVYRIASKLK